MERPPQLTSDGPEAGIALPTVVDPDAGARMQMLTRKDPTFQWPRFLARISVVFAELQPAWSTLEWARARPYVSDQLFQMLAYWIESYKRAHLRNVSENARITGIELAAVTSDRYYDAITVRVHAIGLDYTVDDAGHVVSGSRSRERAYGEYWTLIRGTAAQSKATDDRACPNCGAPLAITMAGNCTHCRAKVTAGDFDWVLSRIEQDAAYTG
jgi:predicted lipid-binding transport protein (Tim44 family)